MNSDLDWALTMYGLFARKGDTEDMWYAVIEGDPWSKQRARFANGVAYQPKADRDAEKATRNAMRSNKPSSFIGNIALACRFYRSNFQRIDTDNLVKHVCDSGKGLLWPDDSQITLALGEVQYDPARPRTVIVVGHHESTMRRGIDRQRPCGWCEKLFIPPAGKRGGVPYCSASCSYAARTTALFPKECPQCHKTFQPTTARQRLCSRECSYASLHGKRRGTGKPNSRCEECGVELTHSRGGRCRTCWKANPNFYT